MLIDYTKTNKTVLKTMAGFFNQVMVPIDILNEVGELDQKLADNIGLNVYIPDSNAYYFASNTSNGLSFEDNICLFDAKNNGWSVVTNDKKMKKQCTDEGIETFWGLQVMILMVDEKLLSKDDAIRTAEKIFKINPRIGKKIFKILSIY